MRESPRGAGPEMPQAQYPNALSVDDVKQIEASTPPLHSSDTQQWHSQFKRSDWYCLRTCADPLSGRCLHTYDKMDIAEMLKTLIRNGAALPRCKPILADERTMVYIAAPYSVPDPVENTHSVIKIADALLQAGFTPLIPHLTLTWHLISPKSYETWLDYDRHLLARCDLLLRVPGYSSGATQECTFANEMNIPVIRPRSADPADCVAALTHFFSN